MTPHCVLFLLLIQVTISLEWIGRVRKASRIRKPWEREGGFVSPAGKQRQHMPDQPGNNFGGFTSSRRTFDRTHLGQFGGIGSGPYDNDHRQQQYGQFNSDKSGCSEINSRRCSKPSDCTGCLGLYSCNVSLQTCRLKGLSHSPSKFLKSLENI